jgi:class 3 adenylate cyclase
MERLSMTPAGLQRLIDSMRDMDVREELPMVTVPTLVMYRVGDKFIDSRHSHFAAEHIAGAKLVELPGADSLPMIGDTEAMLAEIKEFITGRRSGDEVTRRLLTVIFTDLVGATDILARIGDSRFRDLLAAHDETIRREVERFGGQVIKTAGDSFLISFDTIPSVAVECAHAIVEAVAALGIQVRIGLHTGECEIIGDDVGGIAVHIASRIGDLAQGGQVLASVTTYATSVGSGLQWEDFGQHELKGVPVPLELYALR